MTHTILVATADPVDLPIARAETLESAVRQTLAIQLDISPEDLIDSCDEVITTWSHPTLDNLRSALAHCLGDPQILIIHLES